MPALSILHAANVSTPATAAFGLAVQVSTPVPGGFVPIASVTLAVDPVTVLPPASCTVTTGWVVHAVPPVPPPGWVVKASLAAAPTVMLKPELAAEVRAPSVAVMM